MKRISVISVCRNSETTIEETITSIAEQTYPNIQYIIIDGGSTDSTVNLIRKHQSSIDHWISEEDNGIADAMNKAIPLATGDYLLFIHSDDRLISNTILSEIAAYLDSNHDIYTFPVIFESKNNTRLSLNRGFGWHTNFKMGSCHQGHLCSSRLFKRIGVFDTSFSICMDYDFFLRAYRLNASLAAIDTPIAVVGTYGISGGKDKNSITRRLNEERRVHTKNSCSGLLNALYAVYWPLYLFFINIRYRLTHRDNHTEQ